MEDYSVYFSYYCNKIYENREFFIYPATNAALWGTVFKWAPWAILTGGALGVVDTLLIYNKYYDYPVFSGGSLSMALMRHAQDSPIIEQLTKRLSSNSPMARGAIEVVPNQENTIPEKTDLFLMAFNFLSFSIGTTIGCFLPQIPPYYIKNSFTLANFGFHYGVRNHPFNFFSLSPQDFFIFFAALGIIDSSLYHFSFYSNIKINSFLITPFLTTFTYLDTFTSIISTLPNFISVVPVINYIPAHILNYFSFGTKFLFSIYITFKFPMFFNNSSFKDLLPVEVTKKFNEILQYTNSDSDFNKIYYKYLFFGISSHYFATVIYSGLDEYRFDILNKIASPNFYFLSEHTGQIFKLISFFYFTETISNLIAAHLGEKLKERISKHYENSIENRNVRTYLQKKDSSAIITGTYDNFFKDIDNTVAHGSKLLIDSTNHYVNGIIAINYFYSCNADVGYYIYFLQYSKRSFS
jgi:hypothetical protein